MACWGNGPFSVRITGEGRAVCESNLSGHFLIVVNYSFNSGKLTPIPVRGVGLRPLACRDCGFESRRGHECVSLVSVVCCQVEFSATG
jgi:hypothetical protein